MSKNCWKGFLCVSNLIIGSLLFAKPEITQEQGCISGRILDETTQSALVAVNVIVEDTPFGAASDIDGTFEIEGIPAGTYNVQFTMIGYEIRHVNNVIINPNRTTYQQIELKSSVLQGEKIVVSAGYFHEAKDGIVSNRSMDFEEVRSDPGSAQDIQRVVQLLPSVVSGADQENEIIVRGGMPGENLFVMDDIEIANPNHFADQGLGGGPINMLNTLFVRRVDFYAGAFPARYGDKASSVMDISLREGSRTRLTGHSEVGMAGAGLMIEGPLNHGQGSYLFSTRRSYLDLIKEAVGLTAVPEYNSYQGKLVYDISPSEQLIINGVVGQDYIKITPETEEEYDDDKSYVDSGGHQYIFGTTWRHLLGDQGFTKLTLSQVVNHWDVISDDSLHHREYENYSTEIERTARLELTCLPHPQWEMNLGGQFKAVDYDIHRWIKGDTIFVYQIMNGAPVKTGIQEIYHDQDQTHAEVTGKSAFFGHIKWKPYCRFQMTLGLRFDRFELTQKQTLDPRLGFSFTLGKQTKLNTAFGQHSQSPNYIDIAANIKNKNLDYKKTKQVVVGIDHLFAEDMRGTVEVFYKDYKGIPVEKSYLTPDPYDYFYGEMVNAGHGFSKGVEVFLQKKLTHNYHFTFSYAYSIAKGFDERHDRYYNWDYDYRHVLSLMSGVRFKFREKDWYQKASQKTSLKILSWLLPLGDEVDISLRWRYLGGRPYTRPVYVAENQTWLCDESVFINTCRFPDYHRLDLRIDSRYMFKNFNIVTFFDIMNVYGRDNVWDYIYQNDGTVDVVNQFSMVPIGGVTIEF